tara:strand:- start:6232 stop:7269 length:1038 start_codon:yes stop_codon:yes gene_type:complete
MGSAFKSKKAKPAKAYAPAQFQPYSYTSQVGTTTGTPSGSGFNVGSTIDPQLASISQSALGSTQPFLDQYFQQAGQEVPMFSYGDTGEQRARDIFAEQSALLQPQFAQQRQQLKSDLFGSGRMGLMLAGETTGAGGGYVQPDAFGLARAQSMSLADLSGQSRERAMLEQQQGYEQALGGYEANILARQQQLTNYLGGVQAGLGTYGTIGEMEAALVNQGLSIEQARSASQSASASGGAALAQAGTQAKGSLFGDLLTQAASGAASAATTYALTTSDRNLKTNIRKVGELASGLNTYFWDWTEEAKQFVGNQNTFGVIAQEAQLLFPEAVMMHPDGYLQVDYSRIA